MRLQVLYFAPGSGLGHVTRAMGVCLELRELGIAAGIVTNSPFAKPLAQIARIPITHIATSAWAIDAPKLLDERPPKLAVIDTFPNGIRGEWSSRPKVPLVHMARRLRLDNYASFADNGRAWSGFTLTIAIERLAREHETLLQPPLLHLSGLVRLRPSLLQTPVPEGLTRMLDEGASLVIHGGPLEEVERLVVTAGTETPVAAITPWVIPGTPTFDYFPAVNVIERAWHIYTGAGYNCIADTMHHRARHTAIAFQRRFDDQQARLDSISPLEIDATRQAAQAIAQCVME